MKGKMLYVGNYDSLQAKALLLGGGTIVPVLVEERSAIGEMFKNIDWAGFAGHVEEYKKDAPKFYNNYHRKDKTYRGKKLRHH